MDGDAFAEILISARLVAPIFDTSQDMEFCSRRNVHCWRNAVVRTEEAKAEGVFRHPPPPYPCNPGQPVRSGADCRNKKAASVAFLTGRRRRISNQL